MLIGAEDLGLRVQWQFRFAGFGTRLHSTPGTVCIDVGGDLAPGVLDTHQGGLGEQAAAALIFSHPELVYHHLMRGWLEKVHSGERVRGAEWQPVLISHVQPDWDAVVSAFLVMHLIDHGRLPFGAEQLVAYTAEVDQGRYRLHLDGRTDDSLSAAHLGYLAIQNLELNFESSLRRGLELVETVLRDITKARGRFQSAEDFHPPSPGANEWTRNPAFGDAWQLLQRDHAEFVKDQDDAEVVEVDLPLAEKAGVAKARVFISKHPPNSRLNKYWVRAAGHAVYVCPRDPEETSPRDSWRDARYRRVIISVDPAVDVHFRFSLRGLGLALERAECATRHRGGPDPRGGQPRYEEAYCDNADPWYDGRAHGYTIVDSPNAGTILPYGRILDVLTTEPFWEIPLASNLFSFIWADESDDAPDDCKKPAKFHGSSEAIGRLYDDSRETPPEDKHVGQAGTARVSARRRFFPRRLCPNFRIVTVEGAATLEAVLRVKEELQATMGTPDYVFGRFQLGAFAGELSVVDRVIAALTGGEAQQGDVGEDGGDILLLNANHMVLRSISADVDRPLPDPDFEVFLVHAFQNHVLRQFSERICAYLERDEVKGDDPRELREEMLTFQTAYYHYDVSRLVRGQHLSALLRSAFFLPERLKKAQDELARVAEMEAAEAAERSKKADTIIELMLYLLAVAGLFQTIVQFLSWDGLGPEVWWWIGPILLVAILVYGMGRLYYAGWKPQFRRRVQTRALPVAGTVPRAARAG